MYGSNTVGAFGRWLRDWVFTKSNFWALFFTVLLIMVMGLGISSLIGIVEHGVTNVLKDISICRESG